MLISSCLILPSAPADDVRTAWSNGGGDREFTNRFNWVAFADPTPPGGDNDQLPGYEAGAPSNAIIQGAGPANLNSDFTPVFFFSPLILRSNQTLNINANLNISGTSFLAGQTGTANVVNHNSGTVTMGAGVLTIGSGTVGSNDYNLNGGALSLNSITINTYGSLNFGSGAGTGSTSATAVTNNGEIVHNSTDSTSLAAVVSGSGTLSKSGSGTFTLTNANSYGGLTTISGGTLQIDNTSGLGGTGQGTTVASGATLQLNHSGFVTEPITISGAGAGGIGAIHATGGNSDINSTITLAADATIGGPARIDHIGQISDGGNGYTLTKVGNSSLVRNAAANFSHLVINQGEYNLTGNDALPGGPGTTVTVNSRLTLWANRTVTNAPNVIVNSGGSYRPAQNVANSSSINGTMQMNGGNLQLWSVDHTIFSDISGASDFSVTSVISNQDLASYTFAGNNTYTGKTTVGNGLASGKMTLLAGSTTAFGNNAAFEVTAQSTLQLAGNNNSIGSLSGSGTVEDGKGQIADDFSSGSVTLAGVRMAESYIDNGWRARTNTGLGASAWTISGGTLNNSSSSVGPYGGPDPYYQAEGAVIQMVSPTVDSDAITLEFDYNVAAGDRLYVHLWGYTGTIGLLGSRIGNNEVANGAYGNEESEVIGAAGTSLDAFNLKDGADTGFGNTASSISGALTGTGTYSTTITLAALGIPGVSSSGDLSYISLAFAKDEDGTAGTTTIDNVFLGPATATILTTGGDNTSTTFSGVLQDGAYGALGLAKSGTGVQTLSGTNTYTGSTTVDNGTLSVTGANNGSGAVAVNSGGTLGGSGSVTGLVTVNNGGHVAAGTSVGTLTLSGGMTLNDGADIDAELTLGGSADLIDITGGTLTGSGAAGVTVNLTVTGGTPAAGSSYTLMDWTAAAESGVDLSDFTISVASGPAATGYRLAIVGKTLVLTVSPVRSVIRFQ